jgi:hypothetical protein
LNGAVVGVMRSLNAAESGGSIIFGAINGGTAAPVLGPWVNNGGTPATGDVLLASFWKQAGSLSITPPAGWTAVSPTATGTGASGSVSMRFFWKVAVAGDVSASFAFTAPSGSVGYLTSFNQAQIDNTNPILAEAHNVSSADSTPVLGPDPSVAAPHSIVGMFATYDVLAAGAFSDCDFQNQSLDGWSSLLGYRYEVIQTHRGWVQDNDRW